MGDFSRFYGVNSKFVYYNDLARTHPDIYAKLMSEKNTYKENYTKRLMHISLNLLGWASVEANKEAKLLNRFFNTNIELDTNYSMETGKLLIESINTSLSFKDAFQRHLTRILGPEGKKGTAKISAAQFFNDYFQEEFFKIVNKDFKGIQNKIPDMTLDQIADVLFSDENISQALYNVFFIRMKESGDWSKNDEHKGYQEMFTQIEKFNKNELLKQVSQAYHLDTFRDRLIQEAKSNENMQKIFSSKTTAKKYIKTSLKESTTAKGTLGEIVGQVVADTAVSTFQSLGGGQFKFDSKVVGGAKGKADIAMTFGIDSAPLLEVIEKSYGNRTDTVSAYKTLNDYLANIDEGFIVYTNAKDYSLVKRANGYSFGGFSAGSDISLRTFESVISNTPNGSQQLIGQIMNTLSGAVYEDLKDEIEQTICEKMAYLLFDDVLTIGKDTQASGHAIHLLLLDGIYIPLSCLFYLMGRAVEEVARGISSDANEIFKVNLTVGSIKYPEGPWPKEAWRIQKQEAYDQIKIGATFLKSFSEVLGQIMR